MGLPVPVPFAPAGAGTGFVALAWSCLADGSSALPGAPLPPVPVSVLVSCLNSERVLCRGQPFHAEISGGRTKLA